MNVRVSDAANPAVLIERARSLIPVLRERAKQPVPKFLNDKIAAQRNVVSAQRAMIDRLQASYVTTQLKNDATLQRYRKLKEQSGPPDDDTP